MDDAIDYLKQNPSAGGYAYTIGDYTIGCGRSPAGIAPR
jgi:hypothetical protein